MVCTIGLTIGLTMHRKSMVALVNSRPKSVYGMHYVHTPGTIILNMMNTNRNFAGHSFGDPNAKLQH